MSKTRLIFLSALGVVALLAYLSWPKDTTETLTDFTSEKIEYFDHTVEEVAASEPVIELPSGEISTLVPKSDESMLPKDVDLMSQLFQPYPPVLPIVETVSYSGRVDWLSGRNAYLGDYASHYKTSKHFISRSLHGMGNYLSDAVSKGDRFNVIRTDKDVEFHLVLDLSRLKMWAYYYDATDNLRQLLKTYHVCAGKISSSAQSGCLTPCGTFMLGDEIAVYNESSRGMRFGEEIEMVSVFGKRWIPLTREIANCTASCKGLGIHGTPWLKNPETGELYEDRACIGQYLSSGCVRMLSEDIDELFSVIVSRPTYIHVVKDFVDAKLPGYEAKS